jgi:hypothetical protein
MQIESKNASADPVRVCQNCKKDFTIEPEDFEFYKKIDVPPPTWCPECRMVRKTAWSFGATQLYSRICQAPGHSERIVTVFPESAKLKVYDYKFWNSDGWDPLSHGRAYDFDKPFFEQLKQLFEDVPVRSAGITNSISSDYCTGVTDCKNCYLCSGGFGSENCSYSHTVLFSKECVDANLSLFDEQTYSVFNTDKSFKTSFAVFCQELVDCDFMYDCTGCSDCLGCVGLRNQRYCIFNKKYSKEEYKIERAKYDLGSYKTRQDVAGKFEALVMKFPRKFAFKVNAPDSTGDQLLNVKNCKFSFQALDDMENCKFALVAGRGAKECYDIAGAGLKSSLLYETTSSINAQRTFFSYRVYNSQDVQYSRECSDCDHLFACVGLRSKKYCIFNKQYSKEEYNELVPKIIKHAKDVPYFSLRGQEYRYGEFPPIEFSSFPYNSSWVDEYFPLSKDEALRMGYAWLNVPESMHALTKRTDEIPDNIRDVADSILQDVIACSHAGNCKHSCRGVFKLIPSELQFYRKFNIALPRECPQCRFRDSLKHLTPYKLWHRQCECAGVKQRTGYENTGNHSHGAARCPNEFETAYEPGRPEMLYCEQCYNKEIL